MKAYKCLFILNFIYSIAVFYNFMKSCFGKKLFSINLKESEV